MPSLNDVVAGSSADSSCIQQVIDAWKGTSGKGVPLSVTAVSDSANYAVDVKNQDAVNSRGFRVSRANGTVLIQADVNGVQLSATGGSPASIVTINDVQTLSNKTLSLLTSSGNVVQVPQCRVTNTSTQTIGTGSATAITFNTQTWDNDALHSTASNPARISPSRAGLWRFGGNIAMDANSSGVVGVIIRLNGVTQVVQDLRLNTATQLFVQLSGEYQCSTSDYAELVVTQTSGANLGTAVTGSSPSFWASFAGST